MYLFKLSLSIVLIVFMQGSIRAQTSPDIKKSIYFLIDTFSNNKLYKIRNPPLDNMFGSIIKFDYPCYYNGEYSPEFFQFKKTVKTIGKKEVKQLPLMSGHGFVELICKNGVGGAILDRDYDIYFVEKLKKRKYLLYKVFSSPPPRIE